MSHFPSYGVNSCLSWWQICLQLEETLGPLSCVFLAQAWSAGALCITESKPILLSAQQTNKSREKVLVFSNFIWKVRRPRRWWTRVPKNHRAQVRIQSSFIPKEEGGMDDCCKLLGGRILCSWTYPVRLGHDVLWLCGSQ